LADLLSYIFVEIFTIWYLSIISFKDRSDKDWRSYTLCIVTLSCWSNSHWFNNYVVLFLAFRNWCL